MLSIYEKLLFIGVALAAGYFAFFEFKKMFAVIGRGQGPDKIAFDKIPARLTIAVEKLFTQGNILRNRTFSSILHSGIAYAFIFYLIVNGFDTFEGFVDRKWHFWAEGGGIWGVYRLLADLLTVSGLTGMVYFLVRRFVAKDPALFSRENVKLNEKARSFDGIRKDSLIVGLFMIGHLGGRLFGAAAALAWHHDGYDAWQPFASMLANIFPTGDSAEIYWHIGWWVALGLILAFTPYFPKRSMPTSSWGR